VEHPILHGRDGSRAVLSHSHLPDGGPCREPR
jgi:hypothetical protein